MYFVLTHSLWQTNTPKPTQSLNKHSFIGFIALQNQSKHFNIKRVNHLSEANRNRKNNSRGKGKKINFHTLELLSY